MPRSSSPPRRADDPAPRRRADGAAPNSVRRDAAHERDLVCVCGLPAVAALFERDPGRVERLFFEPRLADEMAVPRRLLARARKPYREAAADELARIAGTVRHGGVVAVARPRPPAPFDPQLAAGWARDTRPLLVLAGIGNPHNLGAIVRSAAFFGVERVVLADRPDQALPSAASYRIAEGALDRVSLYCTPLPTALPVLKRFYRIVGTAPAGGTPLDRLRRDRPAALILGNEESGLDAATLALCDAVATIPGATTPGSGRMQSLNVAAAATVLLYALTAP